MVRFPIVRRFKHYGSPSVEQRLEKKTSRETVIEISLAILVFLVPVAIVALALLLRHL